MPTWLSIVIAVIGLCGTLLGILGVTAYASERFKYKAKKKNKAEEDEERRKTEQIRQDLKNAIREVVKEEIKPLSEQINLLTKNLADNTAGTVTLLRDSMKAALIDYRQQGYVSASDKANWTEMYNTYRDLGGNHFKEYVDAWKDEVDQLPRKEFKKN